MSPALRRLALGALLALAAAVLAPAAALAAGTSTRAPQHPRAAPASRRIELELPLRTDRAGLARYAAAVSDPGSPLYHHYLPVRTLAARFGAAPAVRRRVLAYLRHAGARDVRLDVTGLFADATMRVGAAERTFATPLATEHADAASFTAPTAAARVPRALRGDVAGVVGLDTRPLQRDTVTGTSSGYAERTGTAAGCPAALAGPGFTPNQYLNAYGFSTLQAEGLEGQGEKVALIEIDGFNAGDVRAFASCFGLPAPHVRAYGVGIDHALPAGGESTLDLELLDAAAPRLSQVDVYESVPMASEVLRSLTEPLAPSRLPDVISASLSTCEPDAQAAIGRSGIAAVQSALQFAAAAGVSVLAASGDRGSTACLTGTGQPLDRLAVNFPASSPWVTGVGATNVQLSAQNTIADPAADQVVWNDEPATLGASGGGSSTLFPRPAWQALAQSSTHREVPDVSMLGDPLPGIEIECTAADCEKASGGSPWLSVGGTSASTPLLAGGFALVDQLLRGDGRQNLGFADPLLYAIDRSATAAATISDVVSGSNDLSGDVFGTPLGCCTAAAGYDEASGLGSVNVAGLAVAAAALTPPPVRISLVLPVQRTPTAAGHLLATVSCSEACLIGAQATISLGAAGAPQTAASPPSSLRGAGRRTLRIPLAPALRARIRGALAAHQTVSATVTGAVVDAGGTVVRRTAARTLRITG